MARIASSDRRRAGHYTPRQVNGVWTCLDCDAPAHSCKTGAGRASLRCGACGGARRLFTQFLSGREFANGEVARARRAGLLAPPAGFACADCARPAEQYDHRDYGQPLAVEPVCRSCNVMRGPASPLDQRIVLGLIAAAISGGAHSP